MTRRWLTLGLVAALLCGAVMPCARAQEEEDTGMSVEDAFALLLERNIFDPERRAYVEPAEAPEEYVPEETPPPEEWLRLGGVLITDEAALAFLEGSRPEYTVALYLDEYVANLLLIEVDTEGVTFYSEEGESRLPVGSGLARTGEGPWERRDAMAAMPAAAAPGPAPSADEASSDGPDDGSPAASGGEEDNGAESLLERLKRRREQELGHE